MFCEKCKSSLSKLFQLLNFRKTSSNSYSESVCQSHNFFRRTVGAVNLEIFQFISLAKPIRKNFKLFKNWVYSRKLLFFPASYLSFKTLKYFIMFVHLISLQKFLVFWAKLYSSYEVLNYFKFLHRRKWLAKNSKISLRAFSTLKNFKLLHSTNQFAKNSSWS